MSDGNLSTFSSDILVVDDVPENLRLLVNLLTPAGYKVRPASNGAEALDAAKRKKPDLILLDIKMPGMDGFEVCKRLKADSRSERIPVIFISGLGETDDKVKAFRAGGVDYITKPFQEEEVLMRVQTHIELQRMRIDLESIVAERTVDLRMSEERFRMTFEQAAVGVAHVALDGIFLRINQRFCDIVGYSREEMLTRTFQDITHPDDLDTDVEYVRQVLADEIKTYSMEKRYFKKDGEVVWINLTVSLLREDNGKPRYFIAVVADICERKQAEEMLKISQAITHSGNWSVKPADGIVVCSDEVCRIFGLPVGSTCTFEMFNEVIHPDDREYVKSSWKTVFDKDQFDITYRIVVDGQLKWVEVKAASMLHKGDETISVVGTVQDITQRKEAEAELRDSYNEVQELKDRLEQENVYLQKEISLEHRNGEIIGGSTALSRVLNRVEQVAPTDSTVLILGETGTGKELLARAVHSQSDRKARTMVKVNCAALPSTLIESELFGRAKGAYTGALTEQVGRFELAHESTIFLDEVSEMSLELQAKLLRVLQEGQFERLGDPKPIEVDVRVIAATNRDLAEAVRKGQFRDDLYYRLNVFPISIPPLRERREDIPTLVWHFVPEFAERMGKRIESVPKKTMEALQRYSWPGNVRELRNIIENAMIITTGPVLRVEMPQVSAAVKAENASLQEVERNHILDVLEMTDWRIRGENGAAEVLALKPTTLEARIRKLNILRK